MPPLTNDEIAAVLERVSDLLEVQHASPYRVRAYRVGARSVRAHPEPLARWAEEPDRVEERLESLPGIGPSLAAAIRELLRTGRLGLLDRLEGQVSPEDLLTTVPGMGETLARRVHEQLGVETLEDLELAAHDGRLERVPGFGRRRVLLLREALGAMLSRSARRRGRRPTTGQAEGPVPTPSPDVATLLEVDAAYRRRAAAGSLPTIAPRRFNPERRAWLPVMHDERDGWSFTALFSNSARAHELGRTRDWVVIYFERDGDEGQCTVVDEFRGPQRGQRVVRGREAECARHYRRDDPLDAGR